MHQKLHSHTKHFSRARAVLAALTLAALAYAMSHQSAIAITGGPDFQLNASSPNSTTVVLQWDWLPADSGTLTQYEVVRHVNYQNEERIVIDSSDDEGVQSWSEETGVVWHDTGRTGGQMHSYRVEASASERDWWTNSAYVYVQPPEDESTKIRNLRLVEQDDDGFKLAWEHPTTERSIDEYEYWRRPEGDTGPLHRFYGGVRVGTYWDVVPYPHPGESYEYAMRVLFSDGTNGSLSNSVVVSYVEAEHEDQTPLEATWTHSPSHDGSTIILDLTFSESPDISYRVLRYEGALEVENGSIHRTKRAIRGSNLGWKIHISPESGETVTVTLNGGVECSDAAAICTKGGKQLAQSYSAVIPSE